MCASFPERLKAFAIALFDASVFKDLLFFVGPCARRFSRTLMVKELIVPIALRTNLTSSAGS
jgi:hypothetical protein